MNRLCAFLRIGRFVWTVDFDGSVRLVRARRGGPTGWICKKVWGWMPMTIDGKFAIDSYVKSWTPYRVSDIFDGWKEIPDGQ